MFPVEHSLLCRSCLHKLPHARQSPAPEWFMRKVLLSAFCSLLMASLLLSLCWAQASSKLSPEVRAFVKEDAPVIALTHVRVIDGTGTPPRAGQTLVIANGKIIALGDAASTRSPMARQCWTSTAARSSRAIGDLCA